jgi:hypothetical protein
MFLHYCDLIATEELIIYHVFAYFGNLTVQNSQIRSTNSREKSEIRSGVASICSLVCSYKIHKKTSNTVTTNSILSFTQ